VIEILIQINRFLNAFLVNLLPKIAVAIEQANPNKV